MIDTMSNLAKQINDYELTTDSQLVTLENHHEFDLAGLLLELAEQMISERDIYHQSGATTSDFAADLLGSFMSGQATLIVNSDRRAVAYVRNLELLGDDLIAKLGLPGSTPRLYELGSMFVREDHRHDGRSVKALLLAHADKFGPGQLVIGTAKHIRVLRALTVATSAGINFYALSPDLLPWIRAFTCVCNLPFGLGVQHGPDCPKRTSYPGVVTVSRAQDAASELRYTAMGTIDCTMFVSSLELAAQLSEILAEYYQRYTTRVNAQLIVADLAANGYYDSYGHQE